MKKFRLLIVLLAVLTMAVHLQAQKKSTGAINKIVAKESQYNATGDEQLDRKFQPSIHQQMYEQYSGTPEVDQETWIGFTSYDLHSNAAVKHRVHGTPDGEVVASWTYHPETSDPATTYPNRGTGINETSGGAWGAFPSAALEESTRTGWSNILVTSTGRKVVINHASPGGYVIVFTLDPNSNTWTETALPTNVGKDMLWPSAAVSGDNIHVIAITRPPTAGVVHEGLNGAVLYFRSTDGGDNWDVQDYLVPGTDSTFYLGHDVDSYSIAAKGDHVAFSIFDSWGDVVTCHSSSNGDIGSWDVRYPFDFPLDKYVTDSGYDTTAIGGVDPNAPNTLAIETNDGTGGLDIDNNGVVHLTFGRMYVMDDDLVDGNTSFFPGTNGLFYWNSNMADDGAVYIDPVFDAIDIDGNDTIDVGDDISSYGGGLTTQADLIVNDEGTIVISYTQHMENYLRAGIPGSPNYFESQNYRHVYITASDDNGASWQQPYDVTNPDVLFFPSLLPQTEAVFPTIYNDGGDWVHLTYQMDEEPGLALNEDTDLITNNTIAHWAFQISDTQIFTDIEEVVPADQLKFTLVPNPAIDQVQLYYSLTESASTSIYVSDMMGRQVLVVGEKLESAGKQTQSLNIAGLSAGIYLVSIRTNNKIATQKLVVNH